MRLYWYVVSAQIVPPCEIHYWCCLVMVSRLMTYGAAAKLRASCECAHRTVLLVGCWYQGLWSWSIMELHWCVNSCRSFPWNNFYVVCQMIEQHLSSLSDQKGIPLSCVVLFLLILVVTTPTSSLYILWVKVKPWSFLVLEDTWLVLKMENWLSLLLRCRGLFIRSLIQYMCSLTKWFHLRWRNGWTTWLNGSLSEYMNSC
jgi:hypothetical protein